MQMVQRGTGANRSRTTERMRARVKVWPWVVPVTLRPTSSATRKRRATWSSAVVKLGMLKPSVLLELKAATLMVKDALPAGFDDADNAKMST
jgi:hypothetical protein